MDPIEVIKAGHEKIKEQSILMDTLISAAYNEDFEFDNALHAVEYLEKELYDHFKLEELVLFPVARKSVPNEACQLMDSLEKTHGEILAKVKEFEDFSTKQTWHSSKSSLDSFVNFGREIFKELLEHANIEDTKLFADVIKYCSKNDYLEMQKLYAKYLQKH